MKLIGEAEMWLDALTISVSTLWITHLLVELSMDYPEEYRQTLSQSLVLYVLVLAVRLPLFVTIDYAREMKTHIMNMQARQSVESRRLVHTRWR